MKRFHWKILNKHNIPHPTPHSENLYLICNTLQQYTKASWSLNSNSTETAFILLCSLSTIVNLPCVTICSSLLKKILYFASLTIRDVLKCETNFGNYYVQTSICQRLKILITSKSQKNTTISLLCKFTFLVPHLEYAAKKSWFKDFSWTYSYLYVNGNHYHIIPLWRTHPN